METRVDSGTRAPRSDRVALSVIVPVRNDPEHLETCLRSLEASEYPEYEIIVVDDASTDGTAQVARRHGVELIRLESHSGAAAARNLGADRARNPYLLFVDADVRVAPEVLGQIAAVFAGNPAIDAHFGSYDHGPGAANALSQYRNLLHHWVHQSSNREAQTFWTGCGAIKSSVFRAVGGFDASYRRASIEDIEFGARLRRAGYRVVLSKHIQVKHMKRWTLWSMIRCDVLNRGVPWTLLLLREGHIPNDLNLRYSQRLSALFALAMVAMLLVGSWSYPGLLLVPPVILLGIEMVDRWTSREPASRWSRIATAATLAATVLATSALMATVDDPVQPWSLLGLSCLAGISILNLRFYLFVARVKHPLFVLLVIPLHILYFLYSSLAFANAAVLHLSKGSTRSTRRRAASSPPSTSSPETSPPERNPGW